MPLPIVSLCPVSWTNQEEEDEVRHLLRDYAASLAVDLSFQDFDAELAGLPGGYAPPGGLMLLARVDGAPAACGAFRKIDAERSACEMKRLYVRPAFRTFGLGRRLAATLLDRARSQGFRAMFLDTLPDMGAAQKLYESLGFRDVPPYRHNPVPGTRYLRADLAAHSPEHDPS